MIPFSPKALSSFALLLIGSPHRSPPLPKADCGARSCQAISSASCDQSSAGAVNPRFARTAVISQNSRGDMRPVEIQFETACAERRVSDATASVPPSARTTALTVSRRVMPPSSGVGVRAISGKYYRLPVVSTIQPFVVVST